MNVLDAFVRSVGQGRRSQLWPVALLVAAAGCGASMKSADVAVESQPVDPALPSARIGPTPTPSIARDVPNPPPGGAVRVGGDLDVAVTGSDGEYRWEACQVDTPLPAGYPRPTPPGAIELKTYPAARLAEVVGSGDPDRGMNRAFWPLFNHIKRHDIAMTSPVEMYYSGMKDEVPARPDAWSMAFLYRTPDLHATGVEGNVTVRDTEPVTVVSVGLKGDYSMALVERGRRTLQEYLAVNQGWEIAGGWRALYYNGPSLFFWNKWAEVQVPVRRAEPATPTATAGSAG